VSEKELQTVLVMEDDPDIREIIATSLETIGGLEVQLYASGAEGLAALHAGLPDLVLLDWTMPGLHGGEVLQRLRADPRTDDLPVVVLTGTAPQKDVDKMFTFGATDVIAKPFNPVSLASKLGEIYAVARG
jgi:CheY-like chemotaxis protein